MSNSEFAEVEAVSRALAAVEGASNCEQQMQQQQAALLDYLSALRTAVEALTAPADLQLSPAQPAVAQPCTADTYDGVERERQALVREWLSSLAAPGDSTTPAEAVVTAAAAAALERESGVAESFRQLEATVERRAAVMCRRLADSAACVRAVAAALEDARAVAAAHVSVFHLATRLHTAALHSIAAAVSADEGGGSVFDELEALHAAGWGAAELADGSGGNSAAAAELSEVRLRQQLAAAAALLTQRPSIAAAATAPPQTLAGGTGECWASPEELAGTIFTHACRQRWRETQAADHNSSSG